MLVDLHDGIQSPIHEDSTHHRLKDVTKDLRCRERLNLRLVHLEVGLDKREVQVVFHIAARMHILL